MNFDILQNTKQNNFGHHGYDVVYFHSTVLFIDVCVAYDIVDHLKLINMRIKMEDFSVRVRAMQGFIVKSKIILGQLAFDQPVVPNSKIWKKPVNVFR